MTSPKIKTVTIKNVDEDDWKTLIAFTNEVKITMGELIAILAENVRERSPSAVVEFNFEQEERKKEFIIGVLNKNKAVKMNDTFNPWLMGFEPKLTITPKYIDLRKAPDNKCPDCGNELRYSVCPKCLTMFSTM